MDDETRGWCTKGAVGDWRGIMCIAECSDIAVKGSRGEGEERESGMGGEERMLSTAVLPSAFIPLSLRTDHRSHSRGLDLNLETHRVDMLHAFGHAHPRPVVRNGSAK